MDLIRELRERRVPQIASAYIVGSWGVLQFFAFLESRMTVSANFVAVALLLFFVFNGRDLGAQTSGSRFECLGIG
ncbi:MAG: hypothetical protein ACI9UK_000597 [Candidatus Krumholzibacteriia bacterium]|jgi:hypothetical protein